MNVVIRCSDKSRGAPTRQGVLPTEVELSLESLKSLLKYGNIPLAGVAFVDMCPLQTPQKTLMAMIKDEEIPRPEQLV